MNGSSAVFGAMGFAYAAEASGRTSDPELFKTVDYLLTDPEEGRLDPRASIRSRRSYKASSC